MSAATFPCLPCCVALLLGLVVGKAWERYKLRDGRWIDRRRLRETPHYMLGLNFLVDNQVDQAIDELTQATSTDTDALEIQMILGNLYRAEGTGWPRDHRPPGAAAAAGPEAARARLRAALPGPRLPARRLRRSRARGVPGSRAARSAEPLRARQPAEAVRGPAAVGRSRRACASRSRPSTTTSRSEQPDPRVPAQRGRRVADAAPRMPPPRKTFEAAIDIDPRTAPAYLNLGDVRERMGQAAAARRGLGEARADGAGARVSRVRSPRARLPTSRHAASIRRTLSAAHRRRIRRTGARDWRCRGISPRLAGIARRSTCCSTRCRTTRTAWPFTRRSGRRCSRWTSTPALVQAYMELTRKRGLLSRSARLRALPLPQHRAALAVPAVPRVEHVRRRAHGAGERRCHRGVRGDEAHRSDRRHRHWQERRPRRVRAPWSADRRCGPVGKSGSRARHSGPGRHPRALRSEILDDVTSSIGASSGRLCLQTRAPVATSSGSCIQPCRPRSTRGWRQRNAKAIAWRSLSSRWSTRPDANATSTSSSRPHAPLTNNCGA